MRKLSVLIIVFALSVCFLAGCGSESNDGPKCADILNSIKESTDEGFDTVYSYDDKTYQDNFSHMYGLTWDMIDDGGIIYTEKGGLADEISLVHLKEYGDISLAKDKFTARISERRNQFSGYKPEEVYKLDNAVVMVQGDYVALIIGEDPASLEVEVRNAITNLNKTE